MKLLVTIALAMTSVAGIAWGQADCTEGTCPEHAVCGDEGVCVCQEGFEGEMTDVLVCVEVVPIPEDVGMVEFICDVEGAGLYVDSEFVATLPLKEAVEISAGEHLIQITANGYTPSEKYVTIPGGQKKAFKIMLAPVAPAVVATVAVSEDSVQACQDGMDNDSDGYVDCQDQDCMIYTACVQWATGTETMPNPATSNYDPVRAVRMKSVGSAGAAMTSIALAAYMGKLIAMSALLGSDSYDKDEPVVAWLALHITEMSFLSAGAPMSLGSAIAMRKASGQTAVSGANVAGWVLWSCTALMEILSVIPIGAGAILTYVEIPFIIATAGIAISEVIKARKTVDLYAARIFAPYLSPVVGGAVVGLGGTF